MKIFNPKRVGTVVIGLLFSLSLGVILFQSCTEDEPAPAEEKYAYPLLFGSTDELSIPIDSTTWNGEPGDHLIGAFQAIKDRIEAFRDTVCYISSSAVAIDSISSDSAGFSGIRSQLGLNPELDRKKSWEMPLYPNWVNASHPNERDTLTLYETMHHVLFERVTYFSLNTYAYQSKDGSEGGFRTYDDHYYSWRYFSDSLELRHQYNSNLTDDNYDLRLIFHTKNKGGRFVLNAYSRSTGKWDSQGRGL
ncbi:MAG: hypothetical protein H6606_01800 [Flavobacteriales bacterium]|nr:hypothetical protein [Flavobacteriales bacterium]